MVLTLVNVLYVLVAVAMIAFILLQRGAGAAAGSGFGAGASATVFGSRGASNFLSKSTAILAGVFFVMSLGMAMYATKIANAGSADADLGVMGAARNAPETSFETPAAPAPAASLPSDVPAPAAEVPAAVEPAPAAVPENAAEDAAEGNKGD